MKHQVNQLLINDDEGVKKMNASRISIVDLSFANKLDNQAQKLIQGGRINLDLDSGLKPKPPGVDDGTGGYLHGHNSTDIWWVSASHK